MNEPGIQSVEKTDRNDAVIGALALPKATVMGVAREFGISPTMVRKIRDRAQGRIGELQEAGIDRLVARLGDLQARLLDSIDDEAIEEASLQQRMVAFGIVTEKRELLAGRPTQRLSVEDRRSREELLKAAAEELQRRGKAIDLAPTEFEEVRGP